MSKTTKLSESNEQLDMLDTTDNKNYYNVEFRQLEGTPFTLVKDESGFYGVIGSHRVTEIYETEEECIVETTKINWDRLIQVIWAVVDKFNKLDLKKILENE